MKFAIALLSAAVLGVIGCDNSLVKSGGNINQLSEPWASKIEAANAITTPNERDQALRDVAMNAVSWGRGDVAKQCLTSIQSAEAADKAAAEVARGLADRSANENFDHAAADTKTATEIAKMIRNEGLRNKTLLYVAGNRD